jgi:hypothetical protein
VTKTVDGPILGINLAWAQGDSLNEVLHSYSGYFQKMRQASLNLARVWCPPWAAPVSRPQNGLDLEATQAWKRDYFSQLLDLASVYSVRLLIVLLAHVEFLDRDWRRDVLAREHTWQGNPYNHHNGGPCRTPWEFFCSELAIQSTAGHFMALAQQLGSHPALQGWEVCNEPDRVEGFREVDLASWCLQMTSALRNGSNGNVMLTVSLADATNGSQLWRLPGIDLLQIHCHGFPMSDPSDSIGMLGIHWASVSKTWFCGEFGWDSQRSPTPAERARIPQVIGASLAQGCAIGAMPWWWEELLNDDDLVQKLAHLSQALSCMCLPQGAQARLLDIPLRARAPARKRVPSVGWFLRRLPRLLQRGKLSRALRAGRLLIFHLHQTPRSAGIWASSDGRDLIAYLDSSCISSDEASRVPIELPAPKSRYRAITYEFESHVLKEVTLPPYSRSFEVYPSQCHNDVLVNLIAEEVAFSHA